MVLSEFSYALFNMCGFVNFMHRYMQGLPTSNEASEVIAKDQASKEIQTSPTKTPKDSKPKSTFKPAPFARAEDSSEKKKKALEFLDDEIKNFSKKQIQAFSLDSRKETSAAKAGWDDDPLALGGDLDFNDLEISFDKKR
jgi:hypothetical protein